MTIRTILLSGALVFSLTSSLLAQTSGRLSGSVTDATGAAVADATVSLFLAGGGQALTVTKTSDQGMYSFPALQPQVYDLTIERQGFTKHTLRAVKVDAAKDLTVATIRMDVSQVAETVEVSAASDTVQLANAEINTTITNEQIRKLPLLNRGLFNLILNQAGVQNGRGPVVINGMRASYANVSMDGVNIQDNYIRQNTLSYQPNQLLVDQVGEITIATSNTSAVNGGGSSQIIFSSPQGTNSYHGAGYWYNRNNVMAAADWFDNRNGIKKAFLNQNQPGGKIGGPIQKDKLFFFFNAEGFRRREQTGLNRTVLTDSARRGDYTYRDSATGAVRTVNVLGLRGASVDPFMAGLLSSVPTQSNNFQLGDSSAAFTRNTAGYAFQARNNRDRNNLLGRGDYNLSPRHAFSTTYSYNNDTDDRTDAGADFATSPVIQSKIHTHFVSGSWRWNPAPTIVNEMRGGVNWAPGAFVRSADKPAFLVAGTTFTNPVNDFLNQGRATDTYNLSNVTSWFRGRHNIQFGYQQQKVRVESYFEGGSLPTYTLGMGTGQAAITAAELPGSSSNDRAAANTLLATLGGYIDAYTQTFNIQNRNSGFVPGYQNIRNYKLDNYAFFFQDQWKATSRLTLNLGLRWDYQTPVRERDGLFLLPKLIDNNAIKTLESNATLDFAGTPERDLYKRDFNNFGPNIGLAWDVFGNHKTALRAGYSIHFVNDQLFTAITNSVDTNDGLAADATAGGLRGRISTGRPSIPTPTFKVPRTFADNFDIDPAGNAGGIPDPNLVSPYVQQWNLGIQHEFKGTVVEVRYVGNHSTKQMRAFDYNQVDIKAGGFLDDFKRARNNGFLALAARGTFNPTYNAAIAGSQPTPVFNSIELGGLLTNGTVSGLIERGEVGTLANTYVSSGFGIPFDFYRNPTVYGANIMTNYSNSSYNSLQVEVRRRVAAGLNLQSNFTWSKVLSDALGDGQVLFEPFLDNANSSIERSRAPFDLRYDWKSNFIYDLPMGKGHRFNPGRLSKLVGGWSVSGLMGWQSGTPFSILSTRGTINRGGVRSNSNTVDTNLTRADLDNVVGFFMTGTGPFFVNRANVGSDGRGVVADGRTPFTGQAFFNPQPGTAGSLQRRQFSGPSVFSFDAGLQKTTQLTERQSIEFRMEAQNVLNHPTFYVGDESALANRFNVNNTTFGVINSTFTDRRAIQFGLYYRF